MKKHTKQAIICEECGRPCSKDNGGPYTCHDCGKKLCGECSEQCMRCNKIMCLDHAKEIEGEIFCLVCAKKGAW